MVQNDVILSLIKELALPIILGMIGSSGLTTLITFLINRRDNMKKDKKELEEIKKDIKELNLSQSRSEMLIMMNHYPNDQFEILKLAERYFVDLDGDFVMTSIFCKWLEENKITKPNWFNDKK